MKGICRLFCTLLSWLAAVSAFSSARVFVLISTSRARESSPDAVPIVQCNVSVSFRMPVEGGYPAQPWTHGSTLHAVAPSTVTLQDTFGDVEYAVAVSCTNAGVLPRTLFLTPPFQLSARAWAGNATVLHARVTRAVAAAADDPAVALSGRLPVNVTIPLPIADAAPPPARAAATAVAATTLPAFVALALLSLAAVAAAIAAASARRTLLPLPAVPAAAAHAAAQAPLPAVPQPGAPASPIASSASSPLPCPSRAPSPASLTTGSPPTPPPAVLISVTSAPVINVHVALSAHASQSHGGPRVDTAAYAAVADAPLALAPPPAAVPAFYTPAAAAAVTAAATGAAAQWKPSDLPHADGHGRDGDDDPQRAAAGAGAAAYDEPHDDAAAATIAASPAAATASPTVAGRVAAAEHRASPPIRIGADADADADAADGADTTPSLGDVPSTPCIGRGRRRGNATARPSAPTLLLAPAAGPPRGNARGDGGAACMTVALCKHDGDDGFSVAGNPLFTHVAREGRVLGGAAGAGTGGDATALGVPRARDATVVLIVGDDDDGGDEGAASPGSDDSGAGSPRGSLAFRFDRVAGTDWRTIVGGGARGRWSDRRMRLASRHSAVKLSLTCGSGTQPGVSDSGSATAAVTGVARTSETAAPVGAVDASVWTYFYRRPLVRQWQLSAPPSRPTASKPKPPSVGGSPPSSPPASSSVTMRVPAAMPSPPSLPTLRSDLPLPPAVASPLLPAAAPLASSLGSAPSVATSRVQIAMQPPPPPSLLPQLQPALLSVSLPPPPPLLTQSPPPVLSLPVPPQVPARSLSVAALAPVAAVADGATACVPPFPAAHAPHVSMTASASIAAATAPLQSLPSAADAPTSMPPRAISPLLVVTARPAPPSQLALQAMLARRAGAARTVVAERGAEGDCPSPVVPPSQAAAATVVASRTAASAASAEPVSDAPAAMPPLLAPAADDANAKYARMLRVGVPLLSVAQRMRDDGIASDVIAAFVAARESAPPAAAASEQGTTTPGRTPASALLPATPLRRAASDAAADPPTAAMQATASPLARAALARTSSVQTVARLQSLFDAYERGGGAGTPSASSRAPTPVASPFLLRDAAGKAGGGDVTPLPRAKKVSLLDAKGGQRVGIAINRHFKRVSVGVVARSLLTLEGAAFSAEALQSLADAIVPSPSEVAALSAYRGDPAVLAEAETFLLGLLGVPSLRARATLLAFRAALPARLDELSGRTRLVATAAAELLASARLLALRTAVTELATRLDSAPAPVTGVDTSAGSPFTPHSHPPPPIGLLTLAALTAAPRGSGGGGSGGGGATKVPAVLRLALASHGLDGADVLLLGTPAEPLAGVRDAGRVPSLNSLAADVAALRKEAAAAMAAADEVGLAGGAGDVGGDGVAAPGADAPTAEFLAWAAAAVATASDAHASANRALLAALAPSDDAERALAAQTGAALLAVWQLVALLQGVRTEWARKRGGGVVMV